MIHISRKKKQQDSQMFAGFAYFTADDLAASC